MELTILGTSATFPTPRRACSSYLVVVEGTTVLIDLGPGSFSNLAVYARPESLDAIILTHLHQDHFLDVFPLYYYLRYEAKPERPLTVYAPAGAIDQFGCLLGPGGPSRLSEVFKMVDIDGGRTMIGSLSVNFVEVKHLSPTYGVSIEAGGRRLAYSSDSGYVDHLVSLAGNAHLFICEATLIEPIHGVDHLTAEEAGRLASEAAVERLLLTHIWPSIDHEHSRLIAEEHFVGEVILADEGEKMLV